MLEDRERQRESDVRERVGWERGSERKEEREIERERERWSSSGREGGKNKDIER